MPTWKVRILTSSTYLSRFPLEQRIAFHSTVWKSSSKKTTTCAVWSCRGRSVGDGSIVLYIQVKSSRNIVTVQVCFNLLTGNYDHCKLTSANNKKQKFFYAVILQIINKETIALVSRTTIKPSANPKWAISNSFAVFASYGRVGITPT